MKYGETLRQRSVPQWAYQNVAYDSIKYLIKQHTTPGKGKAVAIPGQRDKVDADFENELFNIFADQHANVSLFVRSKSGEIGRRLDHLSKQLRNLQATNCLPTGNATRISPSQLARYGRVEEEALQVGEEIRLLSRYVAAQRTAFIKLLKKYKKWTGRTNLQERWVSDLIQSPESFTKLNLEPYLDHWVESLQNIRSTMEMSQKKSASTSTSQSPTINPISAKQSSTIVTRRINDTLSAGSDVDFDSALCTFPLGDEGARAAYWVHPEQLVELQVLLLQHMRLAFPKVPTGTPSGASSPSLTRRSSAHRVRGDSVVDNEQSAGMIILDDPVGFPLLQNSLSIGEAEDTLSTPSSQPAMSISWAGSSNIAITLQCTTSMNAIKVSQAPVKLKPKELESFLNTTKEFVPRPSTTDSETSGSEARDFASMDDQAVFRDVRKWLSEHRQIQPLVGFTSRRSRFIGLPRGRDCSQWCSLDTNISLKKVSLDDLKGKDWQPALSNGSVSFPYALLKVRREGMPNVDLIKLLDESYLTERVRGFSLAAHALWTCCRPRSMTPPFWLPLLSGDIRKLPATKIPRPSRSSSTRQTSGLGGEDFATSSTAVSNAESSTSETCNGRLPSYNRSVRYATGTRIRSKKPEMPHIQQKRYWSEYDNPEDSNSDAAYYIYINPEDDDSWIPFKSTAVSVYTFFQTLLSRSRNSVPQDAEGRALLQSNRRSKDRMYPSDDEGMTSATSSDSETGQSDILRPTTLNYGTLPMSQSLAAHSSDKDAIGLLLASVMALFFSTILSIILLVLSTVGRRRARGEVDFVILTGLFVSLISAIGGFWGVFKNGPGAARIIVSIAVFSVVVILDGVLAGRLIREL